LAGHSSADAIGEAMSEIIKVLKPIPFTVVLAKKRAEDE